MMEEKNRENNTDSESREENRRGRSRRREEKNWLPWLLPPMILAAVFLCAGILFFTGTMMDPVSTEATLAAVQTGGSTEAGAGEGKKPVESPGAGSGRTDVLVEPGPEASGEALTAQESAAEGSSESGAAVKPEEEKPGTVTLAFAGDIYLSDYVLNAYDAAGGISGMLGESLQTEIRNADFFLANEEFPFSERGTKAPDKQFTFRISPNRAHIMKEIGCDFLALANNHSLDYGSEALLDTISTLDEIGISHGGAGADSSKAMEPVFLKKGDLTIGVLAATRVAPLASWEAGTEKPGLFFTYKPEKLLETIFEVRKQCDYLIVYVHWGVEKKTSPESYQRTMGAQFIDAGADLVVGSHPHVLQGIEYYDGKPILYSLGNFIFGSSIPSTMLAEVTIDREGNTTGIRVVPAKSSNGFTQEMEEGRKADFYRNLEAISFGAAVDSEGNVKEK